MTSPEVDIASLTEDQQLALQQYTSVTDQDVGAAIPLLQRCQWNVQIAIARFFDGEPADPVAEAVTNAAPPQTTRRQEVLLNGFSSSSRPSSRSRNLDPAPRVVPQPDSQITHQAPLLLSILFLPFSLLYSVLSRGFGFLGWVFPFLPRFLSRLSGRTPVPGSRRNTSGRRPLNSRDTAARFIREFEEQYGANTLPFHENGYAQAFDAAKKDLKFLLVLLVSQEHDDTASFIRETLLSPEVTAFLQSTRDTLILWAGDVQDPEAYQVSAALNCTKFPFAGVIVHTPAVSSTAMSVVARIVGPTQPAQFVSRIQTAISQNSEQLNRTRSTRAEQAATRSLREEQNSAYERSLAADRERARQKREAEEARKKEADEARRKAEREEREAQNISQWRRWRATSIVSEPSPGVKDAVRISLRMPEGERVVRRFAPDAPIEELYAFVECYDTLQQDGIELEKAEEPAGFEHEYKFRLVSPMPREAYELNQGGTVGERIGRSGNLIVEMVVSEEEEDEV